MNVSLLSRVNILASGVMMVAALIFFGCEGDTGPQGPPGAPASFSPSSAVGS